MVQAPTRWTADMVREIPEDRSRYEVIAGELVVSPGPSWAHQTAVLQLLTRLHSYLQQFRAGHLLCGPAEIAFSYDTLVQPDLFVVPSVAGKAPKRWEDVKELLLVVEVISPSSARTDRVRKRQLYLEKGAPEYWVVDIDAGLVERWRTGDDRPDIVTDSISWQPPAAKEPFILELAGYFDGVRGE
jgi:Uma2 family endonuclease